MTSELLARLGATEVESAGNQIRDAHARLDKTRCVGWLRATGNRPTSNNGLIAEGRLHTGPQPVERLARAYPEEGCDMHPVDE